MSRFRFDGSYGSALDHLNYNEIFSPVVKGDYANTMVFSPPVNQEEAILKAIESLQPNDEASISQDVS